MNINVEIKNRSENPSPRYTKEGDAGMDIRANEF